HGSHASLSLLPLLLGDETVSGGPRHRLVREESPEPVRLQQTATPARSSLSELELGEDLAGHGIAFAALPVLAGEPGSKLLAAVGRVEDAPHDELRREGAVPLIRLQMESDVAAADTAEAVQLGAQPERDRATGIAPWRSHAEAPLPAVADRGPLGEL